MIYLKHKTNDEVLCEVLFAFIDGVSIPYLRFSKWVWKDKYCREEFTLKPFTKNVKDSFVEITALEFSSLSMIRLQKA
jgi:hypothetical protein